MAETYTYAPHPILQALHPEPESFYQKSSRCRTFQKPFKVRGALTGTLGEPFKEPQALAYVPTSHLLQLPCPISATPSLSN